MVKTHVTSSFEPECGEIIKVRLQEAPFVHGFELFRALKMIPNLFIKLFKVSFKSIW